MNPSLGQSLRRLSWFLLSFCCHMGTPFFGSTLLVSHTNTHTHTQTKRKERRNKQQTGTTSSRGDTRNTRSSSSALSPFLGEGSSNKIDDSERKLVPTYSNLNLLEDPSCLFHFGRLLDLGSTWVQPTSSSTSRRPRVSRSAGPFVWREAAEDGSLGGGVGDSGRGVCGLLVVSLF